MILVTGSLRLQPAQREAALDAVREMRRHTRTERGNQAYEFALDIDDPNVLRIHEEWEDDEALQSHLSTREFADFLERIGETLGGPPDVTRWDGAEPRPLFG